MSRTGKLFNLESWKAFYHAAMEGSMNKASVELGSDVSTISRRIEALENALGYSLLIRKSKCCVLTAEGQIALKAIAPLLLQFSTTIQGLTEKQNSIQGKITFGVTAGLAPMVVSWTSQFQELYPEVTIELHSTPSDPSERITTSDDLAILVSDTESVCYGAKELGRVPTYICASPKYLKKFGTPKKIEDLSMHRIVINSAWMCPSLIYDPNTLEAQAHPTGLRFRVDEMEALRDAAIGEVGIVLGLPKYLFDPEEKRGNLIRLYAPKETMSLRFWMVTPYRSSMPLRVELLAEFIRAQWKKGIGEFVPIGQCCQLSSRS